MKRFSHLLLFALTLLCGWPCQADLVATYDSADDVPLTAGAFSATGIFTATLNFAPPTGTNFMVVKNTGSAFIEGTFSNLAQGQTVVLSHGGNNYRFVANYYGGTGNDLVLQWAKTRPVAWGNNFNAQIGDKSTTDRLVPVDVLSTQALAGKTVVALSAGGAHSLALCSDGSMAAWGSNSRGQLGSSIFQQEAPAAVNTAGALEGKTVVSIAAGYLHNLALCSDGTAVAWGDNGLGQLGDGTTTDRTESVAVSPTGALSGKMVVGVAAGHYHSLALCSDGTVVAWGRNLSGQLGNNSTTDSMVPVAVSVDGALAGKTVIALAVGSGHNLALCSDGTIAAWGSNDSGQLGDNSRTYRSVPVAVDTAGVLAGKTVVGVAAGSFHSLALCSDGTVAAWGDGYFGQLGNDSLTNSSSPVAVSTGGVLAGKKVIGVTAGAYHCVAQCSDGTVVAWGINNNGQLGNNSTTLSKVPVAVSSARLGSGECYVLPVSGSDAAHNLAVIASPSFPVVTRLAATNVTKTGGTLNGTVDPDGAPATASFEYGVNTSYGSSASVTLSPADGFGAQNVSASLTNLTPGTVYHYRLTAITADHTVRTTDGTFATSTDVTATINSASEVPVTTSVFTAAGSALNLTLNFAPTVGTSLMVVKSTGAEFINGRFSNVAQGQLVILSYRGVNYRFIANYYGGNGNDLVLQWAKTRPVGWGSNSNGQLGIDSTWNQAVPVDIPLTGVLTGKTVVSLAVGYLHSLALCSDGTVAAWGWNRDGQLGNNSQTSSSVPVAVDTGGVLSGKAVVAVAAGENCSFALCSDGTVAAWGNNFDGQLGNNSRINSAVPVAVNTAGVLSGKSVVAVAAGSSHSLALCSDGTVAAWGSNLHGSLGNGSYSDSLVPVAVRTDSALAGKTVVAIAVGSDHNLALCSDGTVAAWGFNGWGQLGDNSTTSRSIPVAVNTAGKSVVAIAAGRLHSLGLYSDGAVVAWGDGYYGQLGNRSETGSLVPVAVDRSGTLSGKTVIGVAAGPNFSFAYCSDGTIAAWGDNTYSQLGDNSTVRRNTPVAVSGSALTSGERYVAAFSGPGAGYGGHSFGLIASPSPLVVGGATVKNVTTTGATLGGIVNPNGSPATAYFEYGLDASYGSSVTATLSPDDGFGAQNVSADLTGLPSGTIFHYRLTAVNGAGIVSTADGTFATSMDVSANFNSASDVLISASLFSAEGATFNAALSFAPPTGSSLMVVRSTGLDFIRGKFNNLAQGQVVTLTYGGVYYRFVANYYGGTGNDLVLEWAKTRPMAWGSGVNGSTAQLVPTDVLSTGVLAGKRVISVARGEYHNLVLCSDGTVAASGSNSNGQLGNNSTISSTVPVLVDTTGVLAGKTVVAVAVSDDRSLALCSDGTLATWGRISPGQPISYSSVPVAMHTTGALAGKTVVAIAAGNYDSLALCSDGTIVTWGPIEPVPVTLSLTGALTGKKVVAIAVGGDHTLALCSDGTIAAWGSNGNGSLGDGTTISSTSPVAVSTAGVLSGKAVVAVAAGYSHNLALCSDGTVVTWGYNSWGQLGDNSTTNRSEPVAVVTTGALSGKTVVAVAAGGAHSLALCSDGTIASWGYNSFGELGNNSTASSKVPVAVSSSTLGNAERFVAVFCSFPTGYNLGLVASPPIPVVTSLPAINVTKTGATLRGSVDPNGNSTIAYFEYGLGTDYGSGVSVSLAKNDGIGAQDVSADLSGLTPGTVYHYRLTASSAAGSVVTTDGFFATSLEVSATYRSASDIPVTASAVRAAGGTFNAALNFAPLAGTNLTVVNNTGAGFINGILSNLAHGQLVTLNYGGIDYRFVANYYGGTGNDLVLQWAGTRPVAWGLNSNGQLGDNSGTNRLVPVNVISTGALTGKTVIATAAGAAHSLALCSDGTVAAWGDNFRGQLGDVSTTRRLVPVAVNTAGVLSGKTVVAIAAGSSHSLALCSDGTVAAWGFNGSGQLGSNTLFDYSSVPAAVNTAGVLAGKAVIAIAAGASHSLALCSDGTVAAWGLNTAGQLGNNSTSSSPIPVVVSGAGVLAGKTVVAVAAGSAHSLAMCSDGAVASWGSNSSGQLGYGGATNRVVPGNVMSSGALGGKTVVAVVAGSAHSVALCSDGTVAAWGDNLYGQLGDNSRTNRMAPVLVSTTGVLSAKTVVAVTAGVTHTLARCSDGTVATWGRNNFGQLGNNSTTQSNVPEAMSSSPLAIGESYTAAVSGSMATHNLGLIASPPAPVVATLAATSLTSDSVTLNGTVNAASGGALPAFDYGLDTTYGNSVSGTPTPVSGKAVTAVSAGLVNLVPNTTYHYRVHATSAGGTTIGADLTFTTLPDTTGPVGGTMTLTPASPVNAGIAPKVSFANWMDPSQPLTYSVLIDDALVSAQSASASRDLAAITTAGLHTLKGRIYDALGNYTEVTQSFTVIATQEDWRTFYFGTTQNAGDSADQADPDGDGANNFFEYVAGLTPTNNLSRFNLRVELVAGRPEQKAIVFSPLVAGRTYTVKYKVSLTDLAWTPLTDIATNDNGTERTVTDLSAGNGSRIYQVEISQP